MSQFVPSERYPRVVAGLRERRHRETRQQLLDAAFALFDERGFEAVTVEEIAQAAGVSRSTVYRRFPTKDDLVLEIPRRWLAAFDAAHATIDPAASVDHAIRSVTLAVARHIDEEPDVVRAAYRVLEQAPSLEAASVATAAWIERYVGVVERHASLDRADAAIIAGAYMGAIDVMMQLWAAAGGTQSVEELTNRMLDRLAPILPS